MPELIKDGQVVNDPWQGELLTLQVLNDRAVLGEDSGQGTGPVGVILEPDQPPSSIEGDMARLEMVVINFQVFTDGRCFSYARELRESGYQGEIRATGHFIRDQLYFMQRCGFTAFQFDRDVNLKECLASLADFGESYQAAVDQPQPLFRRRS